jgi:hypothetical protein
MKGLCPIIEHAGEVIKFAPINFTALRCRLFKGLAVSSAIWQIILNFFAL